MPEGDFKTLTAGLFRAARAIRAADELVLRANDERAFWSDVAALSLLPEVVGFHPFAATNAWSVELAERRAADSSPPGRRQLPELPPRAGGQDLARVDEHRVASRASLGRTDSSRARSVRAAITAASAVPAGVSRVTAAPPVQLGGAPVDLARLGELVQSLPPAREEPLVPKPQRLELPAPALRSPGASAPVARDLETAKDAAAPEIRDAVSSLRESEAPSAPLALLDAYTSALLTPPLARREKSSIDPLSSSQNSRSTELGEPGRRASSLPPAPAPRARSLLLVPAELPANGGARTSEATMRAGVAQQPASSLSPAPAVAEDELLERLNQALLEQASLRGVDLT